MGCAAQAACPTGSVETGNGCQLIEKDTAFPKLGLDAETNPMDVAELSEDTQTASMATDSSENSDAPITGDTKTIDSNTMTPTDTLEPDDSAATDDTSSELTLDVSTDSASKDEDNG